MYYVLVLVALLGAWQLCRPRSLFWEIRADIKRRKQSSRESAERMAQLDRLTQQEKEVLRVYVQQPVYERAQDPRDAVIQRLIERGILRPVPGRVPADASVFSVAAWTRSYLASRPELLS